MTDQHGWPRRRRRRRRKRSWLFSKPLTAYYILHTAYCVYYILCILHITGTIYHLFTVHFVQISSETGSPPPPLSFINKCPALAVMSQSIALWETAGKVDCKDAHWRFPPNHYTSYIPGFFGTLQILLVFTYSILHTTFWPNLYILLV